jgi:hypothetical protein
MMPRADGCDYGGDPEAAWSLLCNAGVCLGLNRIEGETMNKRIRIAVLSACAVVSCAAFAQPHGTNDHPVVIVRNGQVSVHPSTLMFRVSNAPVKIVWRIDDNHSAHKFGGGDGVTIDGRLADTVETDANGRKVIALENQNGEIERCKVRANKQELECTNNLRRAGKYKYTVTVQDKNGHNLPPHDPWIMNAPH